MRLCLLALVLLPRAAAISSFRTCDRTVCGAKSTGDLRLSCGGQGEVIESVLAVTFGNALNATCGVSFWDDQAGEDAEIAGVVTASSQTSNCYALSSTVLSLVKDACVNKQECTIPRSALPTTSCSSSVITAAVKCAPGGVVPLDMLTLFAVACIVIIMFAMGCTLVPMDLWLVFREKRVGIIIGMVSQFGWMPLYSFLIAKLSGVDALTAVGIVLCGSAPGGTTSNLFTYWSKGSVALSIVMSFFSNLAAIVAMPLLMVIYIEGGGFTDDELKIPYTSIVASLLMLLVPVLAGITMRVLHDKINCWPFNCRLPMFCCIGGDGVCGCVGAFKHKRDARTRLATRDELEQMDGAIEGGSAKSAVAAEAASGVFLMRRAANAPPKRAWDDARGPTPAPFAKEEHVVRWLCGAGRDVQCIFDCARWCCASARMRELYGEKTICCCWGLALWFTGEPVRSASAAYGWSSTTPGAVVELTDASGAREAEGTDTDTDADNAGALIAAAEGKPDGSASLEESPKEDDYVVVNEERLVYGRGLYCWEWTTKIGSLIGGCFLGAAILTGSIQNQDVFDLSRYWHLWILALSFQPIGTAFGFTLASICGLSPPDMRAVGIETGVQSYALVISVISTSFTGCQRDQILTFPLIAGLCYAINSLCISLGMRFILAPLDMFFDRSRYCRCNRLRCGERSRLDETVHVEIDEEDPLHATNIHTRRFYCPPSRATQAEDDATAFAHRPWVEEAVFIRSTST